MKFNLPKSITTISSTKLVILLSLYFLFGLNFVLVRRVGLIIYNIEDLNWIFALSVPTFFLSAFVIIFTPFIFRKITKPFFIILILISSAVNYGAYNLGVIFSQDMIQNVLETTPAEAFSYFNARLFIWLFCFGVLPSLYILFVKIEYKSFKSEIFSKIKLLLGAIVIILLIAAFFYKDYASSSRNNPKMNKDIVPTYYISKTIKYIKAKYFTTPLQYQKIGMDAKQVLAEDSEKYLVVFLVGETARVRNYQLYGYDRETNPYTSKINNIITLKNTSSCGTATAVSVPCMFSMMNRGEYSHKKFESQDKVIDIIKRAGVEQIWLDNNTGCKGVCDNIEHHATVEMKDLNCSGEECTDAVFLDVLDKQIEKIGNKSGVIYLHLIGSHGPTYYKRYSKEFAVFQPDCQTSDLQKCTDEQIVNSFDNTILFTDYVMSEVIKKLQKYKDYNTAVFYASDHGESLGENGLYLHGMPYSIAPETQTKIPMIMWLSDKTIKHKDIDMECLLNEANNHTYSHDNLSHTLIDFLDIESEVVDSKEDIFHNCERE